MLLAYDLPTSILVENADSKLLYVYYAQALRATLHRLRICMYSIFLVLQKFAQRSSTVGRLTTQID